MPQALGAVALAVFQAGGPIWLSNAIVGVGALGAIGSAVGQIALSFGISFLAQKLIGRPQATKPEDVQQSVRIAASDRVRIYGQFKATGNWVFGDSEKGNFHKVLAVCEGKLVTVINLWIDDTIVTVNSVGDVTAPDKYLRDSDSGASRARFQFRRGLPTETSYTALTSVFPEWTSAFRGDGVVSIYATQYELGPEEVTKVFPSLKDTLYRIEGRFTEVYNPATNTTVWSDNAALVIRDFMTSKQGMRIPVDFVSTPQATEAWIAAYNRARRAIPLKVGGTEPAYRLWGAYKLSEAPGGVLETMLMNCDAQPVLTRDGGMAIRIGDTPAPTVTLDRSLITAALRISSGLDVRTTANRVNAKFLSPADDYLLVDADPWMDEADIVARGEIIDDTEFGWSPSHSQARRLMKLRLNRLTPRWVMTVNCRVGAVAAFQEQFVNVNYRIGPVVISGVFEITSFAWNIDPEKGILKSITIDLQAVAANMYDWNPLLEEGTAPITPTLTIDRSIPDVVNFNVVVARRDISSGQSVAYARISFNAPTASLTVKVQGKKVADSVWQDINVPRGQTTIDGLLMDDGVQYEFRAQNVSTTGRAGEWTDPTVKITPVADDTAPAKVTNVNKTGGVAKVDLFWRTPNSRNFSRVVIRRNTVNDFSTATIVGPVYGSPNVDYTATDSALAPGTYYYWLTAVNGSNFPVNDAAQAVATGPVVVT